MPNYNIYIVRIEVNTARTLIGTKTNAGRADRITNSMLPQINTELYFIDYVENGSEKDLKYKNDLQHHA